MNTYDSNDLKSVLIYIKDRFGLDAFTKPGRVSALLSDLAPGLKNDRVMLERLSRIGVFEDFIRNMYENEYIQKRIISKSLTKLTEAEFIRPTIAASYISILAVVFGWKIEVEIPKDSYEEKMIFDSQQYMTESQNGDFFVAKMAIDSEKFDMARFLFSKAYGNGNVLAGVCLGEMYYTGKGCTRDYDKAVSLFVDGMHRGCPLGAEWLAEAYRVGKGVPKDIDKAKQIYNNSVEALEAMCVSGCVDAQYVFGYDLLYGLFSDKNLVKAYYWLEKARKAGHIAASVQVAKILINGWGQEKDEKAGIAILQSYADTTNRSVHFELGKLYYYGCLKEQDYNKALLHFKKAAECGHASSQDYVGDIYYYGKGVSIDFAEAKKWYELSENQGNEYASLSLGFIYFYGDGVSVDKQKAFKHFKFSADLGNARAQYMLHHFFFEYEQYKNYELGRQYLEKSAMQGDVLAQKLLAKCYIGLFDFVEDDERFVYWIKKAAEQNDAEAQRILGQAYIELDNEVVIPKSYPNAIEWLAKAAENNDIDANILLADIYSSVIKYKNEKMASCYIECAELLLQYKEQNGDFFGEEHEKLADLYYKIGNNKDFYQKAFEHYIKAFFAGQKKSLYDLGWMYFIKDYTSSCLTLSSEDLIKVIIDEEKNSTSSNYAYLLGLIYFNGYKTNENKAEAEQWYLKAIEKGSLSAACKLATYYITECKLYDKGFSILENAYVKGSIKAARLLGLCYKRGIGVKKNRLKAKELLREAADNGDVDAVTELKKFIF